MNIYTIGFTKKSAKEFFDDALHDNHIEIVVDTRINTASQLAGFAKGNDLKYFLQKLHGIKYDYRSDLAPTKELLKNYRDKKIPWEEYTVFYNNLLDERQTYQNFLTDYKDYKNVCVLCSEATPEKCHRRLLAEKIHSLYPGETRIIHL